MKYVELCYFGTWIKQSVKDDQIIVLASQMDSFKKRANPKQVNKEVNKKIPNIWKHNCLALFSNEFKKNGKLCIWCTGLGHNGVGM